MSIDFSKVTELSDQYGNIVEVTDEAGNVLWAVSGGKIVLEVEKITSNTYAGGTTFTGEQFFVLDIYPKTNGTVKVTYGGLTKTITDTSGVAEPNAVQVYFGTLYGVADSVATPASGELTIEGDCVAFGCSSYTTMAGNKSSNTICMSITAVKNMGKVEHIPQSAFHGCGKITSCEIPNTVTSIGGFAFFAADAIQNITIPENVTSIGGRAFYHNSSSGGGITVVMLPINPPTIFSAESGLSGVVYEPFNTFAGLEIIVPKGCSAAYKSATVWRDYADYITEAS